MFDKIIIAVANVLLGGLLKKKPWALWGIRFTDTSWKKIGEGSYRRLKMYADTLFAEGWRTQIIGRGITPVDPPKNLPFEHIKEVVK